MVKWLYNSIIVGLLLILLWHTLQQPKLGVVDVNLIVTKQAQTLAKVAGERVANNKLPQVASKIKMTIDRYAKGQRLLLLAKNVVLNQGLPDHTNKIMAELDLEHNNRDSYAEQQASNN